MVINYIEIFGNEWCTLETRKEIINTNSLDCELLSVTVPQHT